MEEVCAVLLGTKMTRMLGDDVDTLKNRLEEIQNTQLLHGLAILPQVLDIPKI